MNLFVDRYPDEARVVRAALASSFLALLIGGIMGLIQGLHRTGYLQIIQDSTYYTVLSLHGVAMVLLFTIYFLVGFFQWAVTDSLDRSSEDIRFTNLWYILMVAGTLMATAALLGGFTDATNLEADVLYTFYAPLEAHPIFYIGLVTFIIGTWLAGVDWFRSWWAWKQEHPGERTPLRAFMVMTTMLMWYLATIGVAAAILFFILPWSLGLVDGVNSLLTRTLFWFFGHPVVYFWLMPAYMMWYVILPKLSGGRLFSDPLARIVFVLFLLLSVPTGIHHQYVDPGIAEGFKFVAMTNTMFLLLPSLLTAFTVVASMEHGAKQRGGTGRLGWLRALPWNNPAFTGMALAGLMFAAAGFSGMVNAGMNLNYVVHNTLWVPGHFHLTVGTAVALTFMAGTYWFLPQITGNGVFSKRLGLVQVLLWFLGMVFMGNAMHRAGLAGVPRRTADPVYDGVTFDTALGSINELRLQIALGSVILTVSLLLFMAHLFLSWFDVASNPAPDNGTIPEALSGPENAPVVLENLRLWTGIALLLIVLTYVLPITSIVSSNGFFGPAGTLVGTLYEFGVWLVSPLAGVIA
ncbi:b(o/a)3-type cytochrome-c oxidase subunit 1 [Halovenus salina]|uniref:b(o/a)3-type cytochrome-c oxidase subunit 1 n=1 Tax=Halovenus salina TaxID=1510225 RepID=UPI002260C093|nr:b(o/a)3-type cytochrome-c oxidase subunit 1 [Halovenus salina]